jgi:hypothetical protein
MKHLSFYQSEKEDTRTILTAKGRRETDDFAGL